MTLAVVQHKAAINGLSLPPTLTLTSTPTAGNLIVLFVHCNIQRSNITINTAKWTLDFDGFTAGGTPTQQGMTLWRYVQAGDTSTLPAPWTAGSSYTAYEAYEISGVSGTWATDHEDTQGVVHDAGVATTTLSVSHTTGSANTLMIAGAGQYNGSHNPTWNSGWTSDETSNNNGNYGSQSSAEQAVASSGTAITGTVTFGGSSQPADLMMVTLKLASVVYTLTAAEGTYAISGKTVTFSTGHGLTAAQGSYSLSGKTVTFNKTLHITASEGTYSITGHATTIARALLANQGAYHITGYTSTHPQARLLTAHVGHYHVRRKPVTLRLNGSQAYILPTDDGLYELTGQIAFFGQEKLRLSFSEFVNASYLDWSSLGGSDYLSYLNTAYVIPSDIMTWTQVPYIYVFVDDTDSPEDASLLMNVVRNWATNGDVPQNSGDIQVYRHRDGYILSTTKTRVRGRGRVYQVQFRSETGKAFNVRGWASWIEKNSSV